MPETTDEFLLDEAALMSAESPLSVRVAYGTFFCVQAVACIGLLFWSHSSAYTFELLRWSEVASLAILFFVTRDLSVDSGFGVRVVLVFLFHNLISLTLTLYRLTDKGWDRGVYKGGGCFNITMGFLYLGWIICGIFALQRAGQRALKFANDRD